MRVSVEAGGQSEWKGLGKYRVLAFSEEAEARSGRTAADGGRARDEQNLEVVVGKGETDSCSPGEGEGRGGRGARWEGDEVGEIEVRVLASDRSDAPARAPEELLCRSGTHTPANAGRVVRAQR